MNDDFDDLFEEEGEAVPPPSSISQSKVTRSRADDIIDAVEGVKRRKKVTSCPVCSSDRLRIVKPLMGGTKTQKCRDCGLIVPLSSVGPAIELPQKSSQAIKGPYYGPPKPQPDKNSPIFRNVADSSGKK